jgi:hypothetical protein
MLIFLLSHPSLAVLFGGAGESALLFTFISLLRHLETKRVSAALKMSRACRQALAHFVTRSKDRASGLPARRIA